MSINNRVGFVLSNARIVVIRGCWVRWVSLCSPIGRLFVPSFGSGLRFRDWLRLVIASQTELASSFPAPLTRHWDLDTDRFVLDDRSVKSDLRPRPQDRTIDQISPYLLWVGHAGNGGDVVGLHDRGIEAVVQLAAEEPGLTLPRSLLYHRIPLGDGAGNASALLSLAVGTLASLLVLRVPTLVICSMGLSRSPAIAAAALAWVRQESPEDGLRLLASFRSVDVSPALWLQVRAIRLDLFPQQHRGLPCGSYPQPSQL